MDYSLITFRSITFAQQAQHLLRSIGVETTLRRTPKELSGKGCGYGLRLRGRHGAAAVELLRRRQVPFGKVYALNGEGDAEELAL